MTAGELRAVRVMRHGEDFQKKAEKARVAVAGLGGLGSNIAIFLTRVGIGHLHLIDFDEVELSNINRQQYALHHVGRLKIEAMKEQLLAIDPYASVHISNMRIDDSNIEGLFEEDDIVCEAFDDPICKAMLVNHVLSRCPDKYVVAASGMAGYGNSNAIRTRKLSERFILCGDEKSEGHKGSGLIAPRVAIAAAHQANAVLEIINQIYYLNCLNTHTNSVF